MKNLAIVNGTEEVTIAYTDFGAGDPVILISGWPLSKEMWEYQIDTIVNNGFRVIAYDRRGFGHSSKPWGVYDYDTLTNDLHELILHLQLKRVTLVGFSMGGGEIIRYFSKFNGDNISKVVLISAITPYMLKTDTNENGVPQEEFDKMLAAIQTDRMAFLDEFGKVFFGVDTAVNPLSDSSLEFYKLLGGVASPKATKECAIAFSSTDFREEMKSVTVPTLIIHGKLDQTVPILTTSDESTKLIPTNKYIIYEDAAHGLWFTHKERLNDDLLQFLKS